MKRRTQLILVATAALLCFAVFRSVFSSDEAALVTARVAATPSPPTSAEASPRQTQTQPAPPPFRSQFDNALPPAGRETSAVEPTVAPADDSTTVAAAGRFGGARSPAKRYVGYVAVASLPPRSVDATQLCCRDALACTCETTVLAEGAPSDGQARRGHFWNSRNNSCMPLPGWNPPLQPQRGERDGLLVCTSNNTRAVPSASAAAAASPKLGPFRAYHDDQTSKLFRVENFCVLSAATSIVPAVSGARSPLVERYAGEEETRGRFSNLDSFARYLRPAQQESATLPAAATTFPESTPAILLPIPPSTRANAAHTLHRVLSLIGIQKVLRQARPRPHAKANQNGNDGDDDDDVQLVLVELPQQSAEERSMDRSAEQRIAAGEAGSRDALDLMLPALGLSRPPIRVRAFLDGKNDTASIGKWCFAFGVAWQNSKQERQSRGNGNALVEAHDVVDTLPYSFSIWQSSLNQHQIEALETFRRLLFGCLALIAPRDDAVAATTTAPSSVRFPRIVFDVRTRWRRTQHLFLLLDTIQRRLASLFPERHEQQPQFEFVELSSGSVAENIRAVHHADILVCVHGGACAVAAAAMRPSSILLEITAPYFSCVDAGSNARCWFGAIADAVGLHHMLVVLPDTQMSWRRARVPSGVISDALAAATCTWLLRHTGAMQGFIPPALCRTAAEPQQAEWQRTSFSQQQVTFVRNFDVYRREMLRDLALVLAGIELGEEEATGILTELFAVLSEVSADSAPHLYMEGHPIDFWEQIVNAMLRDDDAIGLVRVHAPIRRGGKKKPLHYIHPGIPSPRHQRECSEHQTTVLRCCWCLRVDREAFFARARH